MSQLKANPASAVVLNLRRSGPVDVSSPASSSLYLSAFRVWRDTALHTALSSRDLRCVERCSGELVDAVVCNLPSNTLSYLARHVKHLGVSGSEDATADVRLRVFSLLCELDDLGEHSVVTWVASRLGRRHRSMTKDTYGSARPFADAQVQATAIRINVNVNVPESVSKRSSRGATVAGADAKQVEEALLAQRIKQLQRDGHEPQAPATRALAERYLQQRGVYASLKALPQLIQASATRVSLTTDESNECTFAVEASQLPADEGPERTPFSGSQELFVDLLTDPELTSAKSALIAADNGSITTQAANRILQETRSLLCAPQLHWARLANLPQEQVGTSGRCLTTSGVAGIRSRAGQPVNK